MSEPYGILTMSQFEEIYKVVANKDAEIARLRFTDEEREAVKWFASLSWGDVAQDGHHAATLRSLLSRLS